MVGGGVSNEMGWKRKRFGYYASREVCPLRAPSPIPEESKKGIREAVLFCAHDRSWGQLFIPLYIPIICSNLGTILSIRALHNNSRVKVVLSLLPTRPGKVYGIKSRSNAKNRCSANGRNLSQWLSITRHQLNS